jgi:hypothetical protein
LRQNDRRGNRALKGVSLLSRVTKLAEFSPTGWMFTLRSFLMTKVALIFGILPLFRDRCYDFKNIFAEPMLKPMLVFSKILS